MSKRERVGANQRMLILGGEALENRVNQITAALHWTLGIVMSSSAALQSCYNYAIPISIVLLLVLTSAS